MHHSWAHYLFGTYQGINTNGDATIIIDAPEEYRISIKCEIFTVEITNVFTFDELNEEFGKIVEIDTNEYDVVIDKKVVEFEKAGLLGKSKQTSSFEYQLTFHLDRLHTVCIKKYADSKKSESDLVYDVKISNINRIK